MYSQFLPKKSQLTLSAVLLVFCQLTHALPILLDDHTIITQNNFSGVVTHVSLDDSADSGGVKAGTRFIGSFALYRDADDPEVDQFVSSYTFFGVDRNYSFEISGGPFEWGDLSVESDRSLTNRWRNNFESDGLEESFNPPDASDAGFFDITLRNYSRPWISGSGFFAWNYVRVDFKVLPIRAVSEPSMWLVMLGGLLFLIVRIKQQRLRHQ